MRRKLIRLAGLAIFTGVVYSVCAVWTRTHAEDTLAQAQQELASGQPQAARQTLKWLLWFDSDRGDALMLAGRCCLEERNLASAAQFFSRVPSGSDQHRAASLAEAFAYLNSGRLGLCEEAFQRHLERFPDSTVAYVELKWLFFNQFRRRELERFLDQRLAQYPGNYTVLLDALYTEIREQVAQEAVVPLRNADEAQPDQAPVLLALGYCHWQLGELTTAREQLERALQLRPEHLETRLIIAEFLLEQDQIDAARKLLMPEDTTSNSLLASFENHDQWHWLRHRIALTEDFPEEAMKHLEAALSLRPFDLKYLQTRGSLLQTLGEAETAAEVFRHVHPRATAEQRLLQIVLGEQLEQPTVELCREVAELYEIRGRNNLASGWRMVADRLQAKTGNASKNTTAFYGIVLSRAVPHSRK